MTDTTITLLDQGDGYFLAAPSNVEAGSTVHLGQLSGGGTHYTDIANVDYNPIFINPHRAIKTYREMKKDSQVRNSLRIIKTPITAARWFMQPFDTSDEAKRIADEVWYNLTHVMSTSWKQLLIQQLDMLDYGYMIFEKVFELDPQSGKIIWKKIIPIEPLHITSIEYEDHNGAYKGIKVQSKGKEVFIEIEKLLVFSFDTENNKMRGESILRSAYIHWYMKNNLYKIDAIQKERHGIGVPVIELPPGYKTNDVTAAHQIGTDLRVNESAHVVVPPFWKVYFLKLEGQKVDALASASHHGEMIYENVLANFLSEDNRDVENKIQMFMQSTRYIADLVLDVWNKYAIPQLVYWNYGDKGMELMPSLKVRRLGDTVDWRMMSFALRNAVGSAMLTPDDELEDWLRDEMDLPHRDEATSREVATPQIGQARVGPPQQAPVGRSGEAAGQRGQGRDVAGK